MIKIISPLPVSEEMLGAYLEGNLSIEDSAKIESFLDSDASFKEFVNDINSQELDPAGSVYDDYPNFDSDFNLPNLPEPSEITDNVIDFTPILSYPFEEVAALTPMEIEVSTMQEESALDDLDSFDGENIDGDIGSNEDFSDNIDL